MSFYAEKVFPLILDLTEPPGIEKLRALTVVGVSGKVLEIGFGTGQMLPHYPPEIQDLVVVEPSGGMQNRAMNRIADWGGAIDVVTANGEELPFDDSCFDSVVMSMVLCSVPKPADIVSEIARVLKPKGRYHFLEHVISDNPHHLRWQRKLDRTHQYVACGCSLTCDTVSVIEKGGFEFEAISLPTIMSGLSQKLYPYVHGTAFKRSLVTTK